MKFILDAHLPPSLALYFVGHDVLHTSALPEGNFTADRSINEISLLEDRVVLTKYFSSSSFKYSVSSFVHVIASQKIIVKVK